MSRSVVGRVLVVVGLAALVACGGPTAGSAPAGSGGASTAARPAAPQASTAPSDPALQALVDGARQEGLLTLVWGEGTLGGADGVRRLAEGFNRYYGLNLDVRFTPGPTMSAVAATVAQEYQAGRRSTTDVLVGYDRHVTSLMRVDALAPVDWAAWASNVRDPALIAPGGVAVTFQSGIQGIAYHSGRLQGDAVPKTMQDLLKPQYKGRLATSVGASSMDRLATPEMWGRERTLEYAARMAEQIGGLIRCNEIADRLVTGEFDLFALTCSQSDAFEARARGLPIDYAIAADAPLILYLYLAVPKTAPHPNAAKLWVNYVMSREAQDFLYEVNHADSHLLPGSRTAQDIAALEATGFNFLLSNVEFIQSHDEEELARVLQEVVQLLRTSH